MATVMFRQFSRPQALRSIHPATLAAFLKPHRRYFLSRGLSPPSATRPGELDYRALAAVLLRPDEKTPKALVDGLYLIDEMATAAGMDALIDECKRLRVPLSSGSDQSPADVAMQVWLRAPDILEGKHAERHFARVRRFESYHMDRTRPPTWRTPSETTLRALTADLDRWFADRRRGRGARIVMSDRDDEVWFLVRHGDTLKREESLDDGEASSVCYRPLTSDVVVYVMSIGEIRIHAETVGETDLYRTTFGKHLFGDAAIFPGTNKYSLEPLRDLGEDALAVGTAEGIDWIKLTEVVIQTAGDPAETVARKSADFFRTLASREEPFPAAGRMLQASFKVKFQGCRTPRSVVIKPPNVARYGRDGDGAAVEQWMGLRGFIRNHARRPDVAHPEVLAGG